MALENEPPGHNRLERMGLPGYGKNPGSHRDLPPRHVDVRPPINDNGLDLEGPDFQHRYGSGFGVASQQSRHEKSSLQETSRTVYVLIAASVIAIGSVLANYVQWQKLSESKERRQSLEQQLHNSFQDNDTLERQYLDECSARQSAELTVRLQKTDLERMRQEYERVRDMYRAKLLETQRALPENSDRVSDNTNDGGRLRRGKGTSVND